MYFSTHHFSTRVLNTFRGITAQGYPQLWAGLFISDPTATGAAGVEIAYEGYQRQPIVFTPPAILNGHLSIQNADDIAWPTSDQSPGTATHIGIFDARMGGSMVLRGSLTVPLEIRPQQQPSILAGDIIYWGRGNFSAGFRAEYLNILRGVSLPGFETRIAMHNGNPDTGGIELSGENYSRPTVTFAAPFAAENGVMTIVSESTVTFPTPLNAWGNWAFSSGVKGNTTEVIFSTQKETPEAIHRNYVGRFAQGEIQVGHS